VILGGLCGHPDVDELTCAQWHSSCSLQR
jgi:hypothetical protein